MIRKGLLVVLSGPSGTGKGTLVKLLKEKNKNIRYSISATTRKPRVGETDGRDYLFKNIDDFRKMIKNDELIEWVEYCGNFYGTPGKAIDDFRSAGFDVVLEKEVEGALKIKSEFPDSILIFVLPPSLQELRKRIEGRGTESAEKIKERMDKAEKEVQYIDRYDYTIVNDCPDDAVTAINHIISAEKLKFKRNSNILEEIGILIEAGGQCR